MGIAEENAILEAQRAYFASDEHIIERAARYREMSPEECLAEVIGLCRDADYYLAMKSEQQRERALAPQPIPDDTLAILERLQHR
jgi:hypothetical protein